MVSTCNTIAFAFIFSNIILHNLFQNKNNIWIYVSNFRILDSENCSNTDAVIIAYPSLLLVLSIAGDLNMYSYDSAIFLIPEMDCVRVLTNNSHEMIQKVPKSVNNIFAINSQEPSSWLFEAHKKYMVRRVFFH